MNHGSLFSGIGGFDLAAQWMGWRNIFQVENNKFCISKLEKHFPNVKRYGDIKEFNGTEYRGIIDILTGGFPCQGFSVAGKQRGKSDPRWLWTEMLRIIREIQPPWVIGENVPGIIKLALEDICVTLEGEGYAVQPFIIPSASIGAWDKRERVWIIAYNNKWCRQKYRLQARREMPERETDVPSDITKSGIRGLPIQQRGQNEAGDIDPDREIKINSDTDKLNSDNAGYNSGTISQQQKTEVQFNNNTISKGLQGYSWNDLSDRQKEQTRQAGQANWSRPWIEVASELCRSNARVPHRMDRIKALGNSVNPHVAYEIFKAIENYGKR